MSRLQQIREENSLSQLEVVIKLLEHKQSVDLPLLSKMEHDKCLPTPRAAEIICEFLGCGILDIYPADEITFINQEQEQEQEQTKNSPFAGLEIPEGAERKIQFRLDEYSLQVLKEEVFRELGYKSKSEWFRECVRDLHDRYLETKKTALAGETTKAAR